jgi:hypothetical protein
MKNSKLTEMFGDPIGSYAGKAPTGVVDVRMSGDVCDQCGMFPVDGNCGCDSSEQSMENLAYDMMPEEEMCQACGMPVSHCDCENAGVCTACNMMPMELDGDDCGCGGEKEEAEICSSCGMMNMNPGLPCGCSMMEAKKGPSKKTAKKILKGATTATEKAKKVDSWATNPWAAANWMSQQAGVPLHGKKSKKKK